MINVRQLAETLRKFQLPNVSYYVGGDELVTKEMQPYSMLTKHEIHDVTIVSVSEKITSTGVVFGVVADEYLEALVDAVKEKEPAKEVKLVLLPTPSLGVFDVALTKEVVKLLPTLDGYHKLKTITGVRT